MIEFRKLNLKLSFFFYKKYYVSRDKNLVNEVVHNLCSRGNMLGLVDSVFLKSVLTEAYFVANEKNELTQVLKKNKFNTRTKGT